MKPTLLFLFITLISFTGYSQIDYQKGYYIDVSNKKTECFIKNLDWKNNPTEFQYKLTETSESQTPNMPSIKEFGIDNDLKYVRATVDMDRSSETLANMSDTKSPLFQKEAHLLKVLIEGKATLYSYQEGNLIRYFYSTDGSIIQPLVYKSYITETKDRAENTHFKQQLFNDLKCSSITLNTVEKLVYKKNSLLKFFTDYNTCSSQAYVTFDKSNKKDLFNLNIRPRFNATSLDIQNMDNNSRSTDFGSKTGFGLGIEAEYILPFNQNKWAIAIEPTYQSFKAENTKEVTNVSGGLLKTKIDYASIEIPLTVRYYFFLTDVSKLFVNVSYIFETNLNNTIEFKRGDDSHLDTLDLKRQKNFGFGLGYKLYDKFSAEVRYQTTRDLLADDAYYTSNFKSLSVILGYSIF